MLTTLQLRSSYLKNMYQRSLQFRYLKLIKLQLKKWHLRNSKLAALCLLLACAMSVGVAQAQDRNYLIEVVIFENMAEAKKASSGALYYPRIVNAVGLNSDKANSLGFALLDEALVLDETAQKIRNSGSYRLLRHFAWRQPGLDNKNAVAIRVNLGQTMPLYLPEDLKPYDKFIPASAQPEPGRNRAINTTTVNGTLKVRLGRFLHLDTRLVFTDTENKKSYRLSQSRKMRSGEFHYIDNPRFGLLVKILPLEESSN